MGHDLYNFFGKVKSKLVFLSKSKLSTVDIKLLNKQVLPSLPWSLHSVYVDARGGGRLGAIVDEGSIGIFINTFIISH